MRKERRVRPHSVLGYRLPTPGPNWMSGLISRSSKPGRTRPAFTTRESDRFALAVLVHEILFCGGIAFGLDRWVMKLANANSLREVIAFPKTQRAVCPLTGAPSTVAQKQLDELFLALKPLPKK